MRKTVVIGTVGVLVILAGIFICGLHVSGGVTDGSAADKEAAIEIGKAVICERYGVLDGSLFDAVDEGRTWRVYSYIPPITNPDGTVTKMMDGGAYAVIGKTDGHIYETGLFG